MGWTGPQSQHRRLAASTYSQVINTSHPTTGWLVLFDPHPTLSPRGRGSRRRRAHDSPHIRASAQHLEGHPSAHIHGHGARAAPGSHRATSARDEDPGFCGRRSRLLGGRDDVRSLQRLRISDLRWLILDSAIRNQKSEIRPQP